MILLGTIMHKYLLDTCVFLWVLKGNTDKLAPFLPILENDKNIIFISVATYWEIMIKNQ